MMKEHRYVLAIWFAPLVLGLVAAFLVVNVAASCGDATVRREAAVRHAREEAARPAK